MKPTVGRIVIFKQGSAEQPRNGQIEHPAIITHVFNDTTVNLQVFFDGGPVSAATSVPYENTADPISASWSWPPRVEG